MERQLILLLPIIPYFLSFILFHGQSYLVFTEACAQMDEPASPGRKAAC
jgi:hypothetical protein